MDRFNSNTPYNNFVQEWFKKYPRTDSTWRMLVAMDKLGGIGCLHRFISI